MDINELLADKNLPDNTPIKVGDNEIPLGSLRQATTSQLAAITERAKHLDEREKVLTQRQGEVMSLAEKAQQAYAAAEEARRVSSQPPVVPGNDPFADPWLAPVKAALEARDKQIAELTGNLTASQKMLQNAAVTWAEDRWDKEYDGLDWGKSEKDKRPSRDDLVKFANENKLLDRRGMPSIKMAWDKQQEPIRQADMADRYRQEGIEQGRREALAARIPPPGVPGIGSAPPPPQGGNKGDLGDLYAQSLQDPELRAMLEQLPPGMA